MTVIDEADSDHFVMAKVVRRIEDYVLELGAVFTPEQAQRLESWRSLQPSSGGYFDVYGNRCWSLETYSIGCELSPNRELFIEIRNHRDEGWILRIEFHASLEH